MQQDGHDASAADVIRSFLFVPADSRRKLERSLTGSADAVIFDLEDAVPPERKVDARSCLAEFLAETRDSIEKHVFVRLNDLTTGLTLDDIAATMPFRPDGYVLPKSRGGCDVRTLGLYLDAFEKAYLDESVATKIIAIATETATSVLGLNTYKDASPRLYGLMWGAEDLSSDLGARMAHSNGQWTPVFDLARSMCLFAAAHAGVVAIDTVPTEIHNAEALRTESHTARRDGFAAKAAIHPAQVAVINEAFSASAEELAWATRVVAAFRSGDGVATLDGRMLDRPHLKLATRILTRTAAVDAQRVTSFSDHDATTSRPKLKDQQGVSQ